MSATCGLDFERRLSTPSSAARRVIGEALRELGFTITVDQLTRVEAKRGGMVGYSLMMKKQMPVKAVFELSPDESGCVISAHLTDAIKTIGKTWGVNRQYQEIFDEVQRRIDTGLAGLDQAAGAGFDAPRFWSRSGDIAVLEHTNALTTKAVGGAVGAADRALQGQKGTTPSAWKGVDSVRFISEAGTAVLPLAETQSDLGIAVMIASHPGSLPPDSARDVEAFAAIVERQLTAAGGKATQVEVSEAQRPVFEILRLQSRIRSTLPLRQMSICRSCRNEKITNPEYQAIAKRNERIGDIVAGVGATIGKGGISPTFVLGQVFKLKKLDPAFVCSRCQGMEADERIVTFCPECGELQRDVVLKSCAKCEFDFATKQGADPVWSESETAPEPQPEAAPEPDAPATWQAPELVPIGRPAMGATGGKRCDACRGEYPNLWRVVITTDSGFQERFLCGTTPACQMPSLVAAVKA